MLDEGSDFIFMKRKTVTEELDRIAAFLTKYADFANLNNSDFIIDHNWDILPADFADDLLQLGDAINALPSGKIHFKNLNTEKIQSTQNSATMFQNLEEFVADCCAHSLPNMKSLSSFDLVQNRLGIQLNEKSQPSIKQFMSIKKHYEVQLLGSLCQGVCSAQEITKVVDIGSGLGYLGGYLSLMCGYEVLAIDSVKDRSDAAIKRNKLLKKQWVGLVKKSLSELKNLPDEEILYYTENFKNCSFTPMCLYITSEAQINNLCKDQFGCEKVMFTALHSCGDLSSNIIRLFIQCPSASALCIVGCCYNLLSEQFENQDNNSTSGFPMSRHLKEKNFRLGANTRSLACQSAFRSASSNKNPSDSLFWRALLQVILIERFGRPLNKNQWKIGRLAVKCRNFHDYVVKAIEKLGLEYEITEENTSHYYEKYLAYRQKCLAFYQLRACLGHCIESLIQLDRLLYIMEETSIRDAHLLQLFDPVQSPRCYAIVAVK